MATRAVSIARVWTWAAQDLFGDLRVRYGIKIGLAGVLALFCTQVLRLPNDNWAILTVLVMMSAQFVGSIAFKGIMRVTGTVAGALVGVWLVSDYTSTPAIFLPVLFLVMAFASYKFGQVGARQVPYAYFLFGLTTLVIATDGVTDPAQAWQIGLDRTEEIIVGIISSLLVTTMLWPRYAREEFLEAGRAALKTVSQLFSAHARAYLEAAAISPRDRKHSSCFLAAIVRFKKPAAGGCTGEHLICRPPFQLQRVPGGSDQPVSGRARSRPASRRSLVSRLHAAGDGIVLGRHLARSLNILSAAAGSRRTIAVRSPQ